MTSTLISAMLLWTGSSEPFESDSENLHGMVEIYERERFLWIFGGSASTVGIGFFTLGLALDLSAARGVGIIVSGLGFATVLAAIATRIKLNRTGGMMVTPNSIILRF